MKTTKQQEINQINQLNAIDPSQVPVYLNDDENEYYDMGEDDSMSEEHLMDKKSKHSSILQESKSKLKQIIDEIMRLTIEL